MKNYGEKRTTRISKRSPTSATELRSAGISTAGIDADLDAADDVPESSGADAPETPAGGTGGGTPTRVVNININMILRELFTPSNFHAIRRTKTV